MFAIQKIIFFLVVLTAIVGIFLQPEKITNLENNIAVEEEGSASAKPETALKTEPDDTKITTIPSSPRNDESLVSKQVQVESQIQVSTPPPITLVPLEELNAKTRAALVNILCTTKWSGSFSPITGSGIVIDPKGVILTNAHVAQYYLLKDYLTKDFIDCVIRTGSPASPVYRADLIFISPSWVKNNYKNITSSDPQGTGENDLALLLIKSSADPSKKLPASFPFVAPDYDEESVAVKTPVLLAGYPAGFLGGIAIQKDLWPVSTAASILEIFTYSKEPSYNIDVFSIGGSVVAQKGSSGGAVVSQKSGNLLGIIVTSTDAIDTSGRDLRAISVAHVGRTLGAELGFGLSDLLTASKSEIEAIAQSFQEIVAPSLTKILTDEIR